jgi:hypothetical protein
MGAARRRAGYRNTSPVSRNAVELCRRKRALGGDDAKEGREGGAELWLRIIVASGRLDEPPPAAY